MRLPVRLVLLLLAVAALGQVALASSAAAQEEEPVTVAVRLLEPFVVEEPDGSLGGFSVDLAREIGAEAGRTVEFVVVENVGAQLDAVRAGVTDAAIGAISITADREETVDFSQPMFDSGIQVAAGEGGDQGGVGALAAQVFTPLLLTIVAIVVSGILVAGVVVWLLERHRNPEFAAKGWRGYFDGVWWATVTLLTVGYGDKVPRRVTGRLVSMVWMFLGVLLVATLTAEVTANLTVERFEASIESVGDLVGRDVVTVQGTTSADFLSRNGVPARFVSQPDEGYRQVASEAADAFVYDAAVLRFLVSRGTGNVRLAGAVLQPESYGIAFASGSPLREEVNRALLALREDGTYDRLVRSYFG